MIATVKGHLSLWERRQPPAFYKDVYSFPVSWKCRYNTAKQTEPMLEHNKHNVRHAYRLSSKTSSFLHIPEYPAIDNSNY